MTSRERMAAPGAALIAGQNNGNMSLLETR
jgi:hypothetical protein